MKEITSVKICVLGEAVHFDISRSTTSDDVINMAIDKLPSSNKKCYALFESAFGVQKMLPGQTKLLKQIRSWGANKQNYNLEIKQVDKVKSKMASLARAKEKLQRLRSAIMKHELKAGQKFESYIQSNMVDKNEKFYNKNITVLEKSPSHLPQGLGKKELLKRYLNDSAEYSSFNTSVNSFDLSVRTSGVGCENVSISESELPERLSGDGEEETSITKDEPNMNVGFLECDTSDDSLSVGSEDDLNVCVIYDDHDSSSFEAESDFTDDSDYASLNELERNIIEADSDVSERKLNEIKKIFSNGDLSARITEDNVLESFMNTFVNDEDSDEGLSSVDSDFS